VDVFPTICGLLGVAAPPGLSGRDLLAKGAEGSTPGGEGRPPEVYSMSRPKESTRPRFGLARGGYRYVLTIEDGGPEEALFALGREGESRWEGRART